MKKKEENEEKKTYTRQLSRTVRAPSRWLRSTSWPTPKWGVVFVRRLPYQPHSIVRLGHGFHRFYFLDSLLQHIPTYYTHRMDGWGGGGSGGGSGQKSWGCVAAEREVMEPGSTQQQQQQYT